jgi:hypothetical protein
MKRGVGKLAHSLLVPEERGNNRLGGARSGAGQPGERTGAGSDGGERPNRVVKWLAMLAQLHNTPTARVGALPKRERRRVVLAQKRAANLCRERYPGGDAPTAPLHPSRRAPSRKLRESVRTMLSVKRTSVLAYFSSPPIADRADTHACE